MSNYFLTSWLPNIACGLVFGAGGCLLAKEHGHTVNVDERRESLGTLDTRIEVSTDELTLKPPADGCALLRSPGFQQIRSLPAMQPGKPAGSLGVVGSHVAAGLGKGY